MLQLILDPVKRKELINSIENSIENKVGRHFSIIFNVVDEIHYLHISIGINTNGSIIYQKFSLNKAAPHDAIRYLFEQAIEKLSVDIQCNQSVNNFSWYPDSKHDIVSSNYDRYITGIDPIHLDRKNMTKDIKLIKKKKKLLLTI